LSVKALMGLRKNLDILLRGARRPSNAINL